MPPRVIAVDRFDLVVFGATGDLAGRKLLPALLYRFAAGQMPPDARIIGVARRPMTDDEFRTLAAAAIATHVDEPDRDPATLARFLARLHYSETTTQAGWATLKSLLATDPADIRVFYLATAPELFGSICGDLARNGLITPRARVVIEKPIGKSLASARVLNDAIAAAFPEDRIYRIDHYLGKETVQNLMALRFANAVFEPVWNAAHIDHVQITVAETLGVESRAGYYDTAGALRDMVQNHILQLLCLIAMEPPSSLAADAVRDEKLKVLKSLVPITVESAPDRAVRGQYRGYLQELGRPDSHTETFVALRTEIATWRWAGVPFFLRTGKRLPTRVSEIVIAFRPIPHSVFDTTAGPIAANRLIIRLQPNESVKFFLMIKDPGPGGMRLQEQALNMTFSEAFRVRNPDAYERLLMDVVRGNQTLFMRRDEVEAAWTWIDPILDAWNQQAELPKPYTPGTWGPSASIALIERAGRTWHEDGDAG